MIDFSHFTIHMCVLTEETVRICLMKNEAQSTDGKNEPMRRFRQAATRLRGIRFDALTFEDFTFSPLGNEAASAALREKTDLREASAAEISKTHSLGICIRAYEHYI